MSLYCTFQSNSKGYNSTSNCRFVAAVNHIYGNNKRTLKNSWNKQNGSKSTNHKQQTWPFDLLEVNCRFLRGALRWLTAAKNITVDLASVCMRWHIFERNELISLNTWVNFSASLSLHLIVCLKVFASVGVILKTISWKRKTKKQKQMSDFAEFGDVQTGINHTQTSLHT